jgi:hypothetical protein
VKVLVATKEGQGRRYSDFSWTNEGELVGFAFECDTDKDNIDGGCGCRRSMSGFDSRKATTTFKVIDKNITKDEFITLYLESEKKAGWFDGKTDRERWVKYAEELLETAKIFPVDEVLEKRGDIIQIRG